MQPFTAVFTTEGVVVPDQSEGDSLHQDGYGTKRHSLLYLTPNETLYHMERGKIVVLNEETNEKMMFQEVFNTFSRNEAEIMLKYVVYKDLRTRGFVVHNNANNFFDVYERGEFRKKSPKYLVMILSEGKSRSLHEIQEVLEEAEQREMTLKLAILDRRGEVVYYSLNEISL
jgi:tRNA-intron endonuclease